MATGLHRNNFQLRSRSGANSATSPLTLTNGLWLSEMVSPHLWSNPSIWAHQQAVAEDVRVKSPNLRPAEQQLGHVMEANNSANIPMVPLNSVKTSINAALTADAGAAQAFVRLHDGRLLYDHSSGTWLEFDGVRWAKDELGRISQHGLAVSQELLIDASEMLLRAARARNQMEQKHLKEEAEKLSAASLAIHKKPRLDAMIALAATDPGIAVSRTMFDANDRALCVRNGVIELDATPIVHRPGTPSDLNTLQAACAFDPTSSCPTWDCFLRQVQPDRDVQMWLRRLVGYWLTGHTTEQSFTVFHGIGANGKTVFTETIRKLLGSYSLSADFGTFTVKDKGVDAIRNDIARLDKVRLVVASEGPEGARLDEDLVKRITGGEQLTARFLHREYFNFNPKFKPD
ncbi:MAG: hypothetical protein EPN74_04670 [Rhodanobacter sp.]|nr:MAG: hypothetical protein EPN74_04670 [Rhodanobacter sp.]